jgi:VanZ family protein
MPRTLPIDTGPPRGPGLALVRGIGRALAPLPRALAAIAAVAWMLLIWWLSSGPVRFQPPLPVADFFWNLAHAPVFAVLAVLAAAAVTPRPVPVGWPDPGPARRLLAFALVALWAATDEWHQSHVVGRHGSPLDFATDTAAAASVLWLAAYAGRLEARESGLRRRAGLAVALCAAAAAVTTIADRAALG